MGGSTASDISKTVKGAPKAIAKFDKAAIVSGAAVATGGFVDLENGKINTNLKDMSANFAEGISGGKIAKEFMPKPPAIPAAPNPADQQKRADAEAKKKVEGEVGERGRGYSSTILGGSLSTDNTILRKKRLLGEG